MAATADQIARAKAEVANVEWRVYLGPPRPFVTIGEFVAGEQITVPTDAETTAAITATDTTIDVDDTTGWPGSGTITVTSDAGTGWGSYTGITSTSFTGVRWLHGVTDHDEGATVSQWNDISERVSDDPGPRIREFEDGVFYDWEAPISGTDYDPDIMWTDASVMLAWRLQPDGAVGVWTDWMLAAVGYVRQYDVTGDEQGHRDWSATVKSISTYVADWRITARRYGAVNLADDATISDGYSDTGASPVNLPDPILEPLEFQGGLGTTDADNLLDGNPDTIYISTQAPTFTQDAEPTVEHAHPLIDEVFLEDADDPNLQWARFARYGLGDEESQNFRDYTIYYKSGATTLYIRGPEFAFTKTATQCVLCRDRASFERHYGITGIASVFEWRDIPGWGTDGLTAANLTLDRDEGLLQLRWRQDADDTHDMVVWGAWQGWFTDEDGEHDEWDSEDVVPVPTPGHSIRRYPTGFDSQDEGDWIEEANPMPGDPGIRGDFIWLHLEIPNHSIVLSDDIDDTQLTIPVDDATALDASGVIQIDTEKIAYSSRTDNSITATERGAESTSADSHSSGATVKQWSEALGVHQWHSISAVDLHRRLVQDYVRLTAEITSTVPGAGGLLPVTVARTLPGGVATLRIGSEEILAVALGDSVIVQERGANSTTPAAHSARTPVYALIGGGFSLVPGGPPVVPSEVELWASREESPERPGESGDWENDWLGGQPIVKVSNPNGNLTIKLPIPDSVDKHLPHLMIAIRKMTDGGRAKLNDIDVWREQPARTPPVYEGDTGVMMILRDLLTDGASYGLPIIPSSDITINVPWPAGTEQKWMVSEGTLQDALRGILEQTLTTLRYTLDGRVVIDFAPTHPYNSRPDVVATLDADMVRSTQDTTLVSRFGAEQVQVEIDNIITGDLLTGRYPGTRYPGQRIRRVQIRGQTGDPAAAGRIAQALFLNDPNRLNSWRGTLVGPAEWLHAGDRVFLVNSADDIESAFVQARITEIEHGGDWAFRAVEWRFA